MAPVPTDTVMLATADEDVCLCLVSQMEKEGQRIADELRCTVTARHPISDELIATYEPR